MPSTSVQLGQQLLQRLQVAEILAVRGGVLADQEQLADALLGQPARLGHDLGGRTGDVGAAERRDRTERAASVAAATRSSAARSGRRRTGAACGRGPLAGRCPRGSSSTLRRAMPRDADAGGRGLPVDRGDRQQLAAVARYVRRPAGHRRGSPAAGRRCRRSCRNRAPRRPRAAPRRARCRSARPGSRPRRRPERPAVGRFRSAAASRVSTESFFAASTKPQVFTITAVGVRRVVDQHEPAVLQPGGEFLGVDLVAGATEADEVDRNHRASLAVSGVFRTSSVAAR